ncbi:MAG: excinuclease ABC subunit UvrA [Paludibacteraceae bacterium]|nr:excinuclease ABC subunit UvrA [Candidatus Colousia faecequi]MCQ2338398.1 excinuclease ABC subunit UvrA [Paludibacteraceae bacterium]
MSEKTGCISIRNARVHNLKGVSLEIPREKLIVITGVSGSGKSSLAFDTIYAEGERRYVESLSSYVRQFLGRMNKPEVDFIKGIPPAIAIQQKVVNNNPRSTVGTTTEIYDYLRLLFARIGRTYSPISGREVKQHTVDDVIDYIFSLPDDTAVSILVETSDDPSTLVSQGFSRFMSDDKVCRISDYIKKTLPKDARLIVSHIHTDGSSELRNRLYDSIETAFYEGKGSLWLYHDNTYHSFSKSFEADGMKFSLPTDRLFSFNNPIGACPVCNGYGKILGIDPNLVIPDWSRSIYDDAVLPWRGPAMGYPKEQLILNAEKFGFPIHTPYYLLTAEQRQLLWDGNEYFTGINDFFKDIESQQYKIQYRVMLSRYRGRTVCPACHGSRLKPEASYVKIAGRSIADLVDMPVDDLAKFIDSLHLSRTEHAAADRLIHEISSRISFLQDVGLGYLTLNRQSNTLSGGESQRINLATSLGSALVGSLYILDEPSIGLHPVDTARLMKVLRQLQQLGNTVIIVEHDEDIMRQADLIIDIGPGAGSHGGKIIAMGTPDEIAKNPGSITGAALRGELIHNEYACPRIPSNFIEISGATQNNLKNVTARFPLGVMTAVTGVSGSGKSSLIRDVLYSALGRALDKSSIVDGSVHYGSITGALKLIDDVQMVDQNPIGKSSRSNAATYLKVYDDIRRLFAEQPLAKQMEFTPAHFSFNVDGGRCPECEGEGTVTVPMQFMADIVMSCPACHGRRFKNDILEVKFHDASIHDVLEMTVDAAFDFFSEYQETVTIARKLKPLQDVGLGYLKLGQSSSTLSGGESQRIKLAYFLSQSSKNQHILFIFDEPTTGLHTADITRLLSSFDQLLAAGHTIVVVEHNLNVIRRADWIIDLGPSSGENGGNILYEGAPEGLKQCKNSLTASVL